MKITQHSRSRVLESAAQWTVPKDYFEPLFNYLVHGFEPGSFWTAVLCNDFRRAMLSSHPSNSIPDLKHTVGWIYDRFPKQALGDYETLQQWIRQSDQDRRKTLEAQGLIYTEQEEIFLGLKGLRPPPEPILW